MISLRFNCLFFNFSFCLIGSFFFVYLMWIFVCLNKMFLNFCAFLSIA